MRRLLQLLVVACAATGVAVGGGLLLTLGVDGGARDATAPVDVRPATSAPAQAPRLDELDTTHLAVQRAAFCDLLPAQAVSDALAATMVSSTTYGNGQRGAITPQLTDVAHEFDCGYAAGSRGRRVTARAWVFAPPVTPPEARTLVRAQDRTGACTPLRGAPAFGTPSTATVCHTDQGLVVSYRGLFGDAWLACSLTAGGIDQFSLGLRAQSWCAAVATAASGAGSTGS